MDDVVADKSNRSDGTRLKRNVIMVTKKRGVVGGRAMLFNTKDIVCRVRHIYGGR